MSSELDRDGLVDIFVAEASEAMSILTKALYPSDGTTPPPAQLQEQYVWAHKIRGASGLYGYEGLALMGALLESTLEEAPSIEAALWPKAVEALRGMVASFESQLKVVAQGGAEDPSVGARWKDEVAKLFPSVLAMVPLTPTVLTPDYLVPTLDPEVLSYFAPEAEEYLQTIESLLHRLRHDSTDGETIQTLYLTAHTLKGSAYTIGFKVIGDMAHPIEDCMIAVREGRVTMSSTLVGAISRAMEVIRLLMRRDDENIVQLQHDVPEVTQSLKRIRSGEGIAVEAPAVAPVVSAVPVAAAAMDRPVESARPEVETPFPESPLTDEYLLPLLDAEVLSYFAPEAQEYLESLEAQLLRLEKEQHNSEVINQLFRTAHTLKFSAPKNRSITSL